MALSHLWVYRERSKGPSFSLTPLLEAVRRIAFWLGLARLPAFGACLLFPTFVVVLYLHRACSGGSRLHLSRFRHVCFLTQQTSDISVVSHS